MIRTTGERVGEQIADVILGAVGRASGRAQERRNLPVDLLESGDAYLAVFDAPGALASDVQVRCEDGTLVVRIDRFREPREGFELRFPGRGRTLTGQVELPSDGRIDPDTATAMLAENGTLHVRVPKLDADTEATD